MKDYNDAYEAQVRALLSKTEETLANIRAQCARQAQADAAKWQERIATDPSRWAEIHVRYTGSKLKKKRAEFRRQADKRLALNFNVNGERYDF
jgi:hypothetical protein